jgi:two-component system response regulator YesN
VARILVVDDQELVLTILRDLLSGEGHEVGAASDGEEALGLLHDGDWDLMISDISMPGMTGLDLLRRAKRFRPELRVVMLSGYGMEHEISDFILRGADEYLVKPFTATGLLDVVSRTLCRADPERAGRSPR